MRTRQLFNFATKKVAVSEFQDQYKAGWSRKKKGLFYIGLAIMGAEVMANYYRTEIKFTFQPTPENIKSIQHCAALRQGVYKPTFYLQSAFLQSLYGSKFDEVPYVPMQRHIVPVDNGEITIDQLPVPQEKGDDMRVVVILHGLTGASETNYIRHMALFASRKGFRTFCINMRGYSHSKMTSAQPTDYAKTDDLQAGMKFIENLYPNASVYAIGFSIGSSQLLRYLPQDNRIKGAVAISTPWDIEVLAKEIAKPTKRIYDYAITQNFIRNLRWNLDIYTDKIDLKNALKCSKTRDFDELVTRRLLKYESVDEMYAKVKCAYALKNISIPVLLISSADDPVISPQQIPREKILNNPNLILAQTQRGGHIEWFSGFRPTRWINKPAVQFLQHIDRK